MCVSHYQLAISVKVARGEAWNLMELKQNGKTLMPPVVQAQGLLVLQLPCHISL